ncbi:hypothetical protein Metev_2345 (plasmid) [Methanohalobium evestigatum Z-7303]|uniref:Uncharacterized protein n=1 Tax=Methanohalobium evestigatum (strain ATCC BAA-1072 / DSM 3721 / NBRC 107634 / OCM 161 / Z-7303) TaxID=644295 RepID=D7EC34_METEZ|nr:hypothetical protein Metev_2345 [Methanohalobium evestigatum Z-7303]
MYYYDEYFRVLYTITVNLSSSSYGKVSEGISELFIIDTDHIKQLVSETFKQLTANISFA